MTLRHCVHGRHFRLEWLHLLYISPSWSNYFRVDIVTLLYLLHVGEIQRIQLRLLQWKSALHHLVWYLLSRLLNIWHRNQIIKFWKALLLFAFFYFFDLVPNMHFNHIYTVLNWYLRCPTVVYHLALKYLLILKNLIQLL